MSRFGSETGPPAEGTAATATVDVTVGIDFGTSSAKVAFREFGGTRSVLLPSPRGELLWPCTIYLRDGRLHFGPEPGAEGTGEGFGGSDQPIRWLKMLLAEECGAEREGHRDEMRCRIEQSGCSIQCLTTLLLAYVIRYARDRAAAFFTDRRQPAPHFTFNMGAPLETFAAAADEDAGVGGRVASDGFLQALFWAEKLSHEVPARGPGGGGWPVRSAHDAFEAVRRGHPTMPPQAGRSVFVVPETHAVVTGAVLGRHRLETGQYAIVDIGAGTTDVAIFTYHASARREGRWAVTYLADAVKHEASTQADRCIAELVWDRMMAAGLQPPSDAERMEEARRVKERTAGNAAATLAQGRVRLSKHDFRECVGDLRQRLFDHYKKTLIKAVFGKTKTGHREPFHLLLLGGGSRFAPFREQFIDILPSEGHPEMRPVDTWVSLRDHLRVLRGGGDRERLEDVAEQDYQLYSLVHGLTTHIVRLPAFWLPHDVDDLPPLPPGDRSPYLRDDDS